MCVPSDHTYTEGGEFVVEVVVHGVEVVGVVVIVNMVNVYSLSQELELSVVVFNVKLGDSCLDIFGRCENNVVLTVVVLVGSNLDVPDFG